MAGSVRYRIWIACVLAAVALVLVAVAFIVPFMDAPPAGVAGSIAGFLIAAEIFAALAIIVVGRELYGKLWAKLQAMRAELSELPTKGDDHE